MAKAKRKTPLAKRRWVKDGHIHWICLGGLGVEVRVYPDGFRAICHRLGIDRTIATSTIAAAKRRAVELVQDRLRELCKEWEAPT